VINPIAAYGAAAALLIGLATGWSIRDWKADSDSLAVMQKVEKERQQLQKRYDDLAALYEEDRNVAATNSITRQTELRTIYRDIPIRHDCAAPDSARSLLENSVGEANARATGQSIGTMPETDGSTKSTD
jgi:hypothetical protein